MCSDAVNVSPVDTYQMGGGKDTENAGKRGQEKNAEGRKSVKRNGN